MKGFSLGQVVATGFRIWARNLLPFLLLTILIYSPVLIWGVVVVQGELDFERVQQIRIFLGLSFWLVILLGSLVSAGLTYGVVMDLQGQRASFGACIATGFQRFLPALGTTLLLGLAIGGACILPAMLVVTSPVLGLILVAIAYLWLWSMLYVAVQATVIERPGVARALARARQLTMGHRLAIVVLVIFLGVLGIGAESAVKAIATTSAPMFVYLHLLQQVVLGSIGGVMSGVAYYLLRAEKEGTSAAELAKIFD